ncbi:MAG: hypothetical protein IJ896_11290 [Fibrobacter sp.]|nr:hypothetical protein [Fibrobacter sp.]
MSNEKTKISLFPNMWELCCFIATVIGLKNVKVKRYVWENRKTFYKRGYMPNPIEQATEILVTVIDVAQKEESFPLFRAQSGNCNSLDESYKKSASKYIQAYLKILLEYRPDPIRQEDFKIIRRNTYLRHPEIFSSNNYDLFDKFYRETLESYNAFREEEKVRKVFLELAVWYLGQKYHEKCEQVYNKLFSKTEISCNQIKNLINKNDCDWTIEDEKIAFSIPFIGSSPEIREQLYSEILNKIVRNYKKMTQGGKTHPNVIIDQYTELGYRFHWMLTPKLDDNAKMILRAEKTDSDEFCFLDKAKMSFSKEINDLKNDNGGISGNEFQTLYDDLYLKGNGSCIQKVVFKLINTVPKDIAKQDPLAEIERGLNILEENSSESRFAWQTISTFYPFLGATGYLCRKKLLPYIPAFRKAIKKPMFSRLFIIGIKIINFLSKFKKIPEFWKK